MMKKTYIKPEVILHASAVDNNMMLMGSIQTKDSKGNTELGPITNDYFDQASKDHEIWDAWDD